jgi:hypothetical protein
MEGDFDTAGLEELFQAVDALNASLLPMFRAKKNSAGV